MTLDDFREQNPAYADTPDADLAEGLHAKYYSQIPYADFVRQIGLGGNSGDRGGNVPRGHEEPSFVDKAIEHAKGVAQTQVGGLEAAATGLSRAVVGTMGGGVASLLARATGHDPAAARAAVESYVIQPQTQAGKGIVNEVNKAGDYASAPIAQGANAADEAIGKYAGPIVQDLVRKAAGTASDVVDVLPIAPGLSRAMSLAKQAATPVRATADSLIERARAGGLRVRPSDVNSLQFGGEKSTLAGKAGEYVAGSPDLKADFIEHNKGPVNAIIAEDAGIAKDTPMDEKGLEVAATPHLKVYEKLRTRLEPAPLDPSTVDALHSTNRGSESLLPMPPRVAELSNSLAAHTNVTPGNLIDTISDLRRQGFKGAASEDPDIADAGLARIKMADSLEKQLDAMVARQAPDMVGDYQAARQALGKIHALEATNVAGEVDPQALARLNKKTERRVLTGGQKYVADMAEAFPRVVTRNVPEPREDRPGTVLLNISTGGVVPATRAVARGVMRVTRGESATPQTGLGRALAEYYKGNIDEGRGALKLQPPPGQVGEVSPQQGLNFTEPTNVEATGAPFEGAPKVNSGTVSSVGRGIAPKNNPGLVLASAQDRIPPPTGRPRGTVLARSVEAAKAAAEKLSVEGQMPVPDGRKTPSTANLRLDHPIEGKLPTSIEDLQHTLEGKLLEQGWDSNEVKNALNPKLRHGGALSIPEGRVSGLPAPVAWEWKPDDVTTHVLPFDPSDKKALIKFLRGK